MAFKPASNTPVDDEPAAPAPVKPAGFKPVTPVPVDDPADVADDPAFDELAWAAQNADNPAAVEYAYQVHEKRADRGFKDSKGAPFAHYKKPSMTVGDVAAGFGSFVRGTAMSVPRLAKQAYQAATDDPNAATTTAENVVGAQMAEQNLGGVLNALRVTPKERPTNAPQMRSARGYLLDDEGQPIAERIAAWEAALPDYLARLGTPGISGDPKTSKVASALAKLKAGELVLTPEEDAELQYYRHHAEKPDAAKEQAAFDRARLRQDFTATVGDLRNSMQLGAGVPLNEGVVADFVRSRADGMAPSEVLGPENLASMGAAPVDPGAAAGVAAAVDPVNAALIRVPGLPGARRIGGALVAGTGKVLEGAGYLAKKATPNVARGATAAAGVYAIAGGDVDRALKIGAALVGVAGLRKVGTFGKFLTEAGQEAMTAGAKVAPATAALAQARRGGAVAPVQTAKVAAGNVLVDMAAMPAGALPINAGFSQGDMESFWAMTAGAPLFGVFGVAQGIKPQLVNAIRPQMRTEGQARFETYAKGDKWAKASKAMVDKLPAEQKNAVYELTSALGGLETKGAGGETGVAEIVPLSAKDYAAFKAEQGLGTGDDRGVALHNGKAYINAEHASTQGPGGGFQLAHTAGHEFGGHTALNIMRAATGKGGPLYEQVVRSAKAELGKTIAPGKDGKGGKFIPTPEFQRFIDGYNEALIKGGSPASAKISADNPAAIEEFIAETAGRIFSTKGAADIVIPPGIRDKVENAVGRLFGGALGVGGQSNFGHQENAKVTSMYMDALRQIADPNIRRVTLADDPAQTAAPGPTPAAPAGKPALVAPDPVRVDAELALVALGWPKTEAKNAAATAPGTTPGEIVKNALAAKLGVKTPPPAPAPTPSPAPATPTPAAPVAPPPALAPVPVAAAPRVSVAAPVPGPGGRAILAGTIEPAPAVQVPPGRAPALAPAAKATPPPEAPVTPRQPALAPTPEIAAQKDAPSFKTKMQDDDAADALIAETAKGGERLPVALELATQAAGGDVTLLQKRTDPLTGRVSYGGRLDPSKPEHRAVVRELGLPDADIAKLEQTVAAGNTAKYVDYWSASKLDDADITGKQRKEEYAADAQKKSRNLLQKDKAILFTGAEVFPKGGTILTKGISIDKFVANVGKLLGAAKEHKLAVDYKDINDPDIISDLQGYVANHKAGYKGDGSGPVKGKPQSEGYEPYLIPRNRFDLLNAAFNIDTSTAKSQYAAKVAGDSALRAQGAKVRKRAALRPETELKAEDAQRVALENEWQVDDATGDTNPFRAFINREGKLTYGTRKGTPEVLEGVFERLSPDMIADIRDKPAGEPSIVRDVGFKGDARAVLAKGLPDFGNVAAGFMPSGKERVTEAAVQWEDGTITTGIHHGEAFSKAPKEKQENMPRKSGFVTSSGRFILPPEAGTIARENGSNHEGFTTSEKILPQREEITVGGVTRAVLRDKTSGRFMPDESTEDFLNRVDKLKGKTPPGAAAHIRMFFDPAAKDLEAQFATPEGRAAAEASFAPAREALRAKFGDTVTLYRAESDPKGATGRNVFSYTFSKDIAKQHARVTGAPKPRPIIETKVPLDAVLWVENKGGEQEALVDKRLLRGDEETSIVNAKERAYRHPALELTPDKQARFDAGEDIKEGNILYRKGEQGGVDYYRVSDGQEEHITGFETLRGAYEMENENRRELNADRDAAFMPASDDKPVIIGTAIKVGADEYVRGAKFNSPHTEMTKAAIERGWDMDDAGRGFMVRYQDGREVWVDRKEAYRIAGETGQRAVENTKGELNSQDLREAVGIATGRKAIDEAMAKFNSGEITRAQLADIIRDNSAHFMPETGGFYSQLERVAKAKVKGRATPEQITATLRNNGVKQEELDWVLGDYLRGKAGQKIEPGELAETIKANAVQLKEKQLGKNSLPWTEQDRVGIYQTVADSARQFLEPLRSAAYEKQWEDVIKILNRAGNSAERSGRVSDAQYLQEVSDKVHQWHNEDAGKHKFSQYQLPGGTNYRELLFTLPSKSGKVSTMQLARELYGKELQDLDSDQQREVVREAGRRHVTEDSKDFRSSHYDEPNIIFHTRVNERKTADGRDILFAEEIQSDLHQAGRKRGYKQTIEELPKGWSVKEAYTGFGENRKMTGEFWVVDENNLPISTPQWNGRAKTPEEATRKAIEVVNSNKLDQKVPNLPFKGEGWKRLALKKLLAEAVKAGKAAIGWTTGEQQAARYDLSKQVDGIKIAESSDGVTIAAKPKGGSSFSQIVATDAPRDRLADYVGKGIAEKYLKEGQDVFEGVDLKVGGEGMKGFYDRELPNIANDIAKRYGARAEKGKIGGNKEDVTKAEQETARLYVEENVEFTRRGRDIWYAHYPEDMGGERIGPFGSEAEARREAEDYYQVMREYERDDAPQKETKHEEHDIWVLPITPQLKAAVEAGQALFMPGGKPTAPAAPKTRGALSANPRAVTDEEKRKPALAR